VWGVRRQGTPAPRRAQRIVAAAVAVAVPAVALLVAGCAPWLERPFRAPERAPQVSAAAHPRGPTPPFDSPVPCGGGPYPSRVDERARDALAIGPLVFADLGFPQSPSRFIPGSQPLTLPVVVPPHTRATIAVPPDLRTVAGLDSAPVPANEPARAHRALVCTAGPAQRVFEVSFVVAGARCVPISVTAAGRTTTRRVRFGVRRCRG
jgi:hypothetical protein